ncbi:MAG: hypothetical protein KAY67_06955, partial [Aeromonadaceae bacterium]|nr:hypothetical protein [Aeromonadaceae bacterium]
GLGYLQQGHLTVLNPKKRPITTVVEPKVPTIDDKVHQREAIAWYEFSSYLFTSGKMKEHS